MDNIFKFVCDKNIIFEPEKYPAFKGEFILQKGSADWAHYNKDNECLYSSFHVNDQHLKENNVITSCDAFKDSFYQMASINKPDFQFNEMINHLYDHTDKAFIVGGCGRSGTTLLLSMLSAHSDISAIEESFSFYPQPMRIRSLIKDLKGAKVWCEKTPKNLIVFKKIKTLLKEKAIFIHVVRDGRDVITSRHPTDPQNYWVPLQRWVKDVTVGLDFDAHIVKYEDLINNPQNELQKIFNIANLDFQESSLKPHLFGIKKSDAWFGDAKPLNNKSIERWRKKEYSSIIKRFYKNEKAVNLLSTLGYEL